MIRYPPTPAFAKAGAAPGTTAGVELFRAHSPLSLGHSRQLPPRPLAGSLCCSRVAACPLPAHPSRQLPLAAAATKPSGRQRSSIAACPLPALSPLLFPNKPNTRHCRTQKPPQGHSNGSRAPHGRSNGFLYAFKAAVCQASNAPKPSKPSKSPASSARKRYPNKPNTRHSRTQKPPQGHSNGSRARGQQWLLLYAAAVCQASNKPNTRHSRTQKPPQGHSNGSRAPHGRSNGFFYTRSRLPFARPQTLQTLRPNAPLPHAKVTTRPQQWLAPHGRSNGFL